MLLLRDTEKKIKFTLFSSLEWYDHYYFTSTFLLAKWPDWKCFNITLDIYTNKNIPSHKKKKILLIFSREAENERGKSNDFTVSKYFLKKNAIVISFYLKPNLSLFFSPSHKIIEPIYWSIVTQQYLLTKRLAKEPESLYIVPQS